MFWIVTLTDCVLVSFLLCQIPTSFASNNEDPEEYSEEMEEQCSALKSMKNYKGFDNEIAVNIEKTTRAIDIGPYNIVLDQNWQSQGIPAVVWDAVTG